ncbi:DUF1680 family protein [Sporomusaceae bacterium BoRhaA]|uniref:glycoside hydrolase family 127 protein n=1 Tax=Pelorhabdus rhamnosifermentans TaxID=2772457 RepID=UPI001C061047|nr:beta-L-arabinofuranosidase domain-containing protein [Pelorhabdus rhamnosifermentans]MBU2699876.1 DUF1680 family protein [Pelorhabdus rhamnosifermentans]
MDDKQISTPVSLHEIKIKDQFWQKLMELIRTKVIPYQWEALNDRIEGAEPSHCIKNFKIAAGLEKGIFEGHVFQDSDFAKWIEAVGYSLMWHEDQLLEKIADEAIDIVCAAQQADGYLDTYYILNGLDKRWTNLRDNHELYCLGHMIEGAISYYQATGKDKLLKAMIRYVDYVDTVLGPEEGKKHGYPGHEEIELALVKLYEITHDEKYLKLAKYFIDERGKDPLYFKEEGKRYGNKFPWEDSFFQYKYYQADRPLRSQQEAEGHAVRATYLYSGMTDIARLTKDEELYAVCRRIWDNMTQRQMYITGSIGASAYGESFTYDYDLPNDTVYGETCASIGAVFFARRMLDISPEAQYADVIEKELFNGILSGMSMDGKKFFYVNPLEVVPEASEKDQLRRHVQVERQKWFGCACCPPNIARLFAALGSYIYSGKGNILLMHLYIGGELTHKFDNEEVTFTIKTNYPWDEDVNIMVSLAGSKNFTYALRIPGWCKTYEIKINEETVNAQIINGYVYLQREWKSGDAIHLHFAMPVEVMQANPRVREDIGKVAVMRGPLVYCLEEADNGPDLHRIYLSDTPMFHVQYEPELLDGVVTITSNGKMLDESSWGENLYQSYRSPVWQVKKLKWIPYYAWSNRIPGEMTVWIKS